MMYVVQKDLAEKIVNNIGTPTFVTSEHVLYDRVKYMKEAFGKRVKIFYAVKANFNPTIIRTLKEAGIDGIDAVSLSEVLLAKDAGFCKKSIIFTGNNVSAQELNDVYRAGAVLNLGSISELNQFGKMFSEAEISLRFNPEIGDGECPGVITAGKSCKFGIPIEDINIAKNLIDKYKLDVIGVHCHIGSGMYDEKKFEKATYRIFQIATEFKKLRYIDLGGGFGVRYKPFEQQIKLERFAGVINVNLERFYTQTKDNIRIILEPGKFLVAESTCLLTRITSINQHNDITFVGVDTGMNHIIRPACYSAYHHIVNISRSHGTEKTVKVVGNICESSDVFVERIDLVQPEEGDILAILTAGAYCSSMSSLYNLRSFAAEVLVDDNNFQVTRKRLTFSENMKSLGFS